MISVAIDGLRGRQIHAGAASGRRDGLHLCGYRCDVPHHRPVCPAQGKDPKDNEASMHCCRRSPAVDCIDGEQHIYLNGEDVSTAIRTDEVAWRLLPWVPTRQSAPFCWSMQRDMTRTQNVLMDGRDIGTWCCPCDGEDLPDRRPGGPRQTPLEGVPAEGHGHLL